MTGDVPFIVIVQLVTTFAIVIAMIVALRLFEIRLDRRRAARRVVRAPVRRRTPEVLEGVFRFGSRKFRRTATDVQASQLLMTLEQRRTPAGYEPPLYRSRADFRRLIHDQPIVGLVWCLAHGDRETRRLAVWLLGRCGHSRMIEYVAQYRLVGDRRMRITVARALKRLRARAELQSMAELDEDQWIRQFAATHADRSFSKRLSAFLGHEMAEPARNVSRPESKMELVVLVEPAGRGKRPKSAEFIRRILERIREFVHGSHRVGNGHHTR